MGATKHERSFVDYEMPYERNIIGLRGIIYFAIGLLVLIVITFGLMWALLGVLEDNAQETKSSTNPMVMSEIEALPTEPRLQGAPGFGVEGPDGRINLELREPQAEYRQLYAQWKQIWEKGSTDKNGMAASLPIEQAKQQLLSGGTLHSRNMPESDRIAAESQLVVSDASSGRMKTLRRR